jgi:hypothetical protein
MNILDKFRWANPVLRRFGRQIVPLNLGHWSVDPEGRLVRASHQIGWYLAGPGEWEGLPPNATCLDRFRRAHR